MPENALTVGFLGLGLMGRPMAVNVAKAGFQLTVYNRTREKAEALASEVGANVADTPADIAHRCDVTITMLADQAAIDAVYHGRDGLVEGLSAGTVAVDMSTTGPGPARALASTVARTGASFVEAPVSGSVAAAESAGLTLLVGGEQAAVDRAAPVLHAMGAHQYHLGPVGSGQAMKLAVNAIVYGLSQAISEALVLAERSGVDRAQAYDVFMNSAIAAPLVEYRKDEYVSPESAPTTFVLRLAQKDLQLITEQAASVDTEMPQAHTNLRFIDELVERGLGDSNLTASATYLRDAANADGEL